MDSKKELRESLLSAEYSLYIESSTLFMEHLKDIEYKYCIFFKYLINRMTITAY